MKKALKTKYTDTHVYFVGGQFSNWHPSLFTVSGIEFKCGEQFLMYHKAIQFGDNVIAAKILTTSNPAEIKRLGRQVSGFDNTTWEKVRESVALTLAYNKFSQNADLKQVLLDTGTRIIVEGSETDRIWGVGLYYNNPKIEDEANWKGLNLLGKSLMAARDMIIREIETNV